MDEPIGDSFLPERVRDAILETFLDFGPRDRLTMALAFTQVVHGLLSAVGQVLEHAVQLSRNQGSAPIEVPDEPEEDSDDSIYMQTGLQVAGPSSSEPLPGAWLNLVRKLQAALEAMPKNSRAANVGSCPGLNVAAPASMRATSWSMCRVMRRRSSRSLWPTGTMTWLWPRRWITPGVIAGLTTWTPSSPSLLALAVLWERYAT